MPDIYQNIQSVESHLSDKGLGAYHYTQVSRPAFLWHS